MKPIMSLSFWQTVPTMQRNNRARAQANKRNWIWWVRTVVITVKRLLREDRLVTQPEPMEASQGASPHYS